MFACFPAIFSSPTSRIRNEMVEFPMEPGPSWAPRAPQRPAFLSKSNRRRSSRTPTALAVFLALGGIDYFRNGGGVDVVIFVLHFRSCLCASGRMSVAKTVFFNPQAIAYSSLGTPIRNRQRFEGPPMRSVSRHQALHTYAAHREGF